MFSLGEPLLWKQITQDSLADTGNPPILHEYLGATSDAEVVEGDKTAAAIKSDSESDFMLGDCCTTSRVRDEREEEGGEGGKRRYQGYRNNNCPPPNMPNQQPMQLLTTTADATTIPEDCWHHQHHASIHGLQAELQPLKDMELVLQMDDMDLDEPAPSL